MMPRPALVATLGLQPQVITRSLDILLENIEPELGEVTIIHTGAFPITHPHWHDLADLKANLQDTYPDLTWQWVPIVGGNGIIVHDVETPEAAEMAFRVIYRQVRSLKREDRKLHGLIAGGRKSMIVFTMVSAQLLFDIDDRLWHLFSSDEGPDPHLPPTRKHHSKLIEIPVLQLSGLVPMIHSMILDNDDPTSAITLYKEHEDRVRVLRLREFYDNRDEIDQQILLLAYSAYSNREIADQVHVAEGTVARRMTQMADDFYKSVLPPPSPFPGHIRLRFLHHMRPLLRRLVGDDI